MSATWFAAALCVGVMGFAIQRGGTCTVAAVDELLTNGSAYRLLAMLEASLWVAGGLALAQLAHLAGSMPPGFAVNAWTVAGGVLLGLGAWVNGACVFGAIARLGSGQWAYAVTPLGFFVGCLSVASVFGRPVATVLTQATPVALAPALLAPLFALYVVWRLGPGLRMLRGPGRARWLQQTVWAPHAATILIGASFVVTLLLAGRWAYTDVLADLARRMGGVPIRLGLPLLLLAALVGGALLGGRSAGLWRATRLSARQLGRCFVGGALMGWGSLLIPGSNDGLILIGLPMLHPYAWLAFASMVAAIASALGVQRAWAGRRQAAPTS